MESGFSKKETDVENAINHAISKYGKLDIMYNNAGIVGVAKPNILDNTKAEFEQVVSVNLTKYLEDINKGFLFHANQSLLGNTKKKYISYI